MSMLMRLFLVSILVLIALNVQNSEGKQDPAFFADIEAVYSCGIDFTNLDVSYSTDGMSFMLTGICERDFPLDWEHEEMIPSRTIVLEDFYGNEVGQVELLVSKEDYSAGDEVVFFGMIDTHPFPNAIKIQVIDGGTIPRVGTYRVVAQFVTDDCGGAWRKV